MMKKILIVGLLSLCSIVISFGQTGDASTKQDSLPPEIEAFIDEEIATEGLQMTCQELRKKQGKPQKVVILDTRDRLTYRNSHIGGARRIGVQGKDFTLTNIWYLNRNNTIVVYCENGVMSKKVAAKLRKMGFSKTYNLLGGFAEWNKRLLPTQGAKKGE
jgi:rhodanese-related sulfurtransferase